MKKIMIALLFLGTVLTVGEAKAQVSININIGNQPAWGPTGYDYVDFYYLPDINCYYDIGRAMFVYPMGSRWVYARSLPSRYRGVNLYNTYKVVINQRSAYRYNKTHIREYARYRGMHNQPMIRDSRDSRYYVSKGHPMHQQWVQGQNRGGQRGRVEAGPRNDHRKDHKNDHRRR